MEYSEKILSVQPSATLAITSKAKAMKAEGKDVIILAAGEPDHDTPQIVKDAAIKAIQDGFTKYTPASGTQSLKESICNKFRKDNNLDYSIENIIVSNGAKHSIYNVLQVLCNPGDEVLIIHPFWLSYPEMVKLAGGVPKIITTKSDNGFKLMPEELKFAISDKTKAIILNSPSNPAGIVYTKDELAEIGNICVANNLTIISDEIYEKIIYDGREHVSIAAVSQDIKNSTIIINGVSKSYSMTGWRIGYAAGEKDIISRIATLQSHATSNPCSISQIAAECALTADLDDSMKANCMRFAERRDFLLKELKGNSMIKPVNPSGAFYLFCNIEKTGMDSISFAEKLLGEKQVAVIPGAPFGASDFIRISFATDIDTISRGIDRIKDWVSSL